MIFESVTNISLLYARNETLRLQPPIPTSLQRAPALGSGGKTLGDMYTYYSIPPTPQR